MEHWSNIWQPWLGGGDKQPPSVPCATPPTCSGLAGDAVVVLVDVLRGLVLGLADHRGDGGRVDIGQDAASHSLQSGKDVVGTMSSPQHSCKTFLTL